MDINDIFIGVMSINMGIGLACAFILQFCKLLFRSWLTEEDVKANNILTFKATCFSIFCFIILILVVP